jgi:hypothetical protein
VLGSSDGIDEWRLRLAVAVLLCVGAVYFFRLEALTDVGAALGGGVLVLLLLYAGQHWVGMRGFSRAWPGISRGLATALLVGCLCPPGLPIALVAVLGAGAVIVEALVRRLGTPIAVSGVLLAWGVAWLWWYRTGLPLLAPFSMHTQDEPIMLWTRFQLAIDPVRLYTGNVSGPIGATSFGLAAVGVLLLGYGRRVSWLYLAAFFVPPAAALLISRQPLSVYLLSGEAVVLAGIVAAEVGRMPQAWNFRVAAGLVAGAISAVLLVRGWGGVAFGVGVLGAAILLTALQVFDVLGARTPAEPGRVRPAPARDSAVASSAPRAAAVPVSVSPLHMALLVLLPPVGLVFLWRNETLSDTVRINLVALGSLLYAGALAGSLAWLWLLRLPA